MALNNELTLNSDTEARQTAADEVQRVVSRPIEAFGGGLVVAMAGISSFLRLPRARNYSPCESSTDMRRSANCVGARARVTPPHLRIGRATLSFFFFFHGIRGAASEPGKPPPPPKSANKVVVWYTQPDRLWVMISHKCHTRLAAPRRFLPVFSLAPLCLPLYALFAAPLSQIKSRDVFFPQPRMG